MRVALSAAALSIVAIVFIAGGRGATTVQAQDIEAQALQIERQLLCPQCTNKRLDVCELPICVDMRALIREELAEGVAPDEIVLFFSNRYGERVLAELPKSGFNLLLFGWVGGSTVLVALAGGLTLLRMRRSAAPAPAGPLDAAEERWLDEQMDGEAGAEEGGP